MDAQGWAIVIGAVFTGLTSLVIQVLSLLLSWMAKHAAEKAAITAEKANYKVAEVKMQTAKAEAAAAAAREEIDKKLAHVTEKVEEVHKATNSLTDRLVEATANENFAKGVQQGEKNAAEKPPEKPPCPPAP